MIFSHKVLVLASENLGDGAPVMVMVEFAVVVVVSMMRLVPAAVSMVLPPPDTPHRAATGKG